MAEAEKTVVRPNTDNYTSARSSSGSKSQHNGDAVAQALQGATVDEVVKLGAEILECTQKDLRERYEGKNDGMVRMNIGNRIRGVINKMNKAEEGTGDSYISEVSSGLRDSVEKREAKAEAEKAKKAEAAEKAKAAKEKKAKAK